MKGKGDFVQEAGGLQDPAVSVLAGKKILQTLFFHVSCRY